MRYLVNPQGNAFNVYKVSWSLPWTLVATFSSREHADRFAAALDFTNP